VYISRLERGKQQPKLVTIFEIAAALNVKVSRILYEVELLLLFNDDRIYDSRHLDYKRYQEHFGEHAMICNPDCTGDETILLVEDEEAVRQYLMETLTGCGHNVLVAEDGQEAVEKFRENREHIDLVLMDIMMPRKDGIAAYREIRSLDPQAKVLLMSGYSPATLGSAEKNNFIQKPMQPRVLLTKIRNILDGDSAKLLSAHNAGAGIIFD
jgi:CheY-like chemotaxis protein